IAAIEIRCRRAGRHVDDATPNVDRHPCPGVRPSGGLPSVRRPRLVAEFARTRDRVEGPTNRTGAHVVRANVARRRALLFADARALDEKILIDGAGASRHKTRVPDVAAEALREIDRARITKGANRIAGARVESVEAAAGSEEDASLIAVCPIGDAAVDVRLTRPVCEGIESPDQRATVGAQGDR